LEKLKEIHASEYVGLDGKIILKWVLRVENWRAWTELCGLQYEKISGFYIHNNEPSGSIMWLS